MRTRRSYSRRIAALGLTVVAVLAGGAGAGAQEVPLPAIDEAGWQGVLGIRAAVSTAQRYVVLLEEPALANRVRAAGGQATEAQMRGWTTAAERVQEQFFSRMAAAGARVAPEHRYVRVLNGFSARLDPTALALLDRDREVASVYPVRAAFPAQTAEALDVTPSAVRGLEIPGLDGTGVTVALLDTGIDPSHPYLRGSLLPGIDLISPGSGAVAQPHPTIPGRPERHGTELAGIITGSDGPGGLHGVAPGASILPVRVAGWQPDAEGGYTVYARTDQIIAGLEAAVDPNEDGDTHDAARVALIGFVEPYASFPSGPLGRAIGGATSLDMLVVVPAGNDGRAGPSFGSIAGPGGAPAALTVAAADGRPATPTIRVQVRAGLRVLFEDTLPLGGAPTRSVTAEVVPVTRAAATQGIAGLFDAGGISTVAGRAALLPRGLASEETVEEATTAGAVVVLVDGRLPAGAFSLDVPIGVPVVGLPDQLVGLVRAMIAAGVPVTVAVGAVDIAENDAGGSVAAFSSHGLAFGGGLKPDLVAPGVAVPTSEPGRGEEGEVRFGTVSGTSVAAAVAAGTAAVLAEGRPRARAVDLIGLLAGSAQRRDLDAAASGAGLLDLRSAVQQEIAAEPALVSFGIPRRSSLELEQVIRIRNLSTRALTVSIQTSALAPKGVEITVDPQRLRIRAARSAPVVLRADTSDLSDQAGAATGELVLAVSGSSEVHVPWAVAVPTPAIDLLSRVALEATGNRVSDVTPAALSLVAGALIPTPGPQVRPLEMLEVQLRRSGELIGVLARRREVLPGRYTFGLTGRGPGGERLRRGSYVVRVVARPGDGLRQQAEDVVYRVR
jgi:minor extracellular serine protease Vpr